LTALARTDAKGRGVFTGHGSNKKPMSYLNNLGMVGQGDNATLLFFIFLTRLFKNPLHAIVMGSSGSGKTHLLQGVASTIPGSTLMSLPH
jgi:DNA primase